MKKMILASASPRRKEILALAGFEFEVLPGTNEEVKRGELPGEIVENLAVDKARDVAARCEGDCLVLGADTIVVSGGEIMGKPVDEADAYRMIRGLQGAVHQVYTGVAMLDKTEDDVKVYSFHQKTDVWVYPMTDEEIYGYIATKDPMDKAGAYGIQGQFGMFIEKIDGDYLNVVGLPLARLWQEMKQNRLV